MSAKKTKTLTKQKDHVDSDDCWCKPDKIYDGKPAPIRMHHDKKKVKA